MHNTKNVFYLTIIFCEENTIYKYPANNNATKNQENVQETDKRGRTSPEEVYKLIYMFTY